MSLLRKRGIEGMCDITMFSYVLAFVFCLCLLWVRFKATMFLTNDSFLTFLPLWLLMRGHTLFILPTSFEQD